MSSTMTTSQNHDHSGRSRRVRRALATAATLVATGLAVSAVPASPVAALPDPVHGNAKAQVRIAPDGTPSLVAGRYTSTRFGFSPDGFEVSRTGVGEYQVLVKGIDASGGTAHLVPWARRKEKNPPICTIEQWNPTVDGQLIDIRCFDGITGAPREGRRFDVWFTTIDTPFAFEAPADGGLAYLWANGASSPTTYSVDPGYSFSETGVAAPTVTRASVGVYDVEFSEPLDRTTPYVTAYGGSARWCHPARSTATGPSGRRVRVVCFGPGGVRADSMFTLTMAARDPWAGFDHLGGRIFVKRPARTTVQQPSARNVNAQMGPGKNTYVKVATGRHRIEMPRTRGAVDGAFVQASGPAPRRCFVTGLVTSENPSLGGVMTRCIDGVTRQPVDSRQWVARYDQSIVT
jgi:hypothetical protein